MMVMVYLCDGDCDGVLCVCAGDGAGDGDGVSVVGCSATVGC